MKFGPNGLRVLQYFEGLRLDAYPDPATGAEPITIGYGSTKPGVYKLGMRWTEQQAEEALLEDLQRFEVGVLRLVTRPMTQGQFDALVSFSFNVGLGNFEKSTLLKKLNAGDYTGAKNEFAKWTLANGKPMSGLRRRRAAEAALFAGFTGDSAIAAGKAAA